MEIKAIVLTCEHKQGIAKVSKQPYDFYAGILVSNGIKLDFTSNSELKADTQKEQIVKVLSGKVQL